MRVALWYADVFLSVIRFLMFPNYKTIFYLNIIIYVLLAVSFEQELRSFIKLVSLAIYYYPFIILSLFIYKFVRYIKDYRLIMLLEIILLWARFFNAPVHPDEKTRIETGSNCISKVNDMFAIATEQFLDHKNWQCMRAFHTRDHKNIFQFSKRFYLTMLLTVLVLVVNKRQPLYMYGKI